MEVGPWGKTIFHGPWCKPALNALDQFNIGSNPSVINEPGIQLAAIYVTVLIGSGSHRVSHRITAPILHVNFQQSNALKIYSVN